MHAPNAPSFFPSPTPSQPPRSGRVLRAELRGETVAAKEVDLGQQFELQEAFVAEAHQVGSWVASNKCAQLPSPGHSGAA